MYKMLAVGLVVFLLVAVPSIGFAATHYVPDDYGTIQAALDGAVAGDEIIVRDGAYAGTGNKNLDFGGKALTLRSENGAGSCFIHCQGSGRGFYFHSGETVDSVVDGFSIMNGNATDGGGISCSNSSSPAITNCSITANTATTFGGGIYCNSSSPTITDCFITANTATTLGGGIYCDSSSPTITNCSITANTAVISSGGGIHCDSSSPTITDCFITANTSIYGCGIYCSNFSSPVITDCSITANTSTNNLGRGGGILCTTSSSPVITNCSITANTVPLDGGGIWSAASSSPVITNCSITMNTANNWGGGIYCSSGSSPTITDCLITANTATTSGGGIYCSSSSPAITNCSITLNTASGGGGIFCENSSSPAITNCSITANTADIYDGGGIYCIHDSSPTITNSILWNDSPDEIYVSFASPSVTYSDVEGGYAGTGNINSDPLFAGAGYRLTAGSPCIDAGTDAGVYDDIDGEARPAGAGYDMGCDEFVPAPSISCYPASFTASCLQGSNPAPQELEVWNSGGGTLSYSVSDDAAWLACTPSSGTSTGEADSITVSYNASGLAPGTYQATITISDPSASNDPQYVPVELTVAADQLTSITLQAPSNVSVLSSPPTFSWEGDGGTNNVYAVDLSLSYPITGYWSTYENLGLLITNNSWTPSAWQWSAIPSGSFVYWRVRGANLDHSPLTIITSGQVWCFFKQ